MPLHLKKLCVGVSDLEQLETFTKSRRDAFIRQNPDAETPWFELPTRNMPKRAAEILENGSLYWVINKKLSARQKVLALRSVVNDSGKSMCMIRLELNLVPLIPRLHRPFQGWRYLENDDIPQDIAVGQGVGDQLPAFLLEELDKLGLV